MHYATFGYAFLWLMRGGTLNALRHVRRQIESISATVTCPPDRVLVANARKTPPLWLVKGGLMSKLAVVAIGGNSLIKDEAHKTVPDQFAAVRETVVHIAEMIEQGWNVVITHGNGPQVGFILLRSEYSRSVLHPVPLDSCGP